VTERTVDIAPDPDLSRLVEREGDAALETNRALLVEGLVARVIGL
jgi:hypothetical protein